MACRIPFFICKSDLQMLETNVTRARMGIWTSMCIYLRFRGGLPKPQVSERIYLVDPGCMSAMIDGIGLEIRRLWVPLTNFEACVDKEILVRFTRVLARMSANR